MKKMKNPILLINGIIFFLSLFYIISYLIVILLASSNSLYLKSFNKNNTLYNINETLDDGQITTDDLNEISQIIINYLTNKSDTFYYEIDGSQQSFFSEQATLHMRDVKQAFNNAKICFYLILLLLIITIIVFVIKINKNKKLQNKFYFRDIIQYISKAFIISLILIGIIILIILAGSLIWYLSCLIIAKTGSNSFVGNYFYYLFKLLHILIFGFGKEYNEAFFTSIDFLNIILPVNYFKLFLKNMSMYQIICLIIMSLSLYTVNKVLKEK